MCTLNTLVQNIKTTSRQCDKNHWRFLEAKIHNKSANATVWNEGNFFQLFQSVGLQSPKMTQPTVHLNITLSDLSYTVCISDKSWPLFRPPRGPPRAPPPARSPGPPVLTHRHRVNTLYRWKGIGRLGLDLFMSFEEWFRTTVAGLSKLSHQILKKKKLAKSENILLFCNFQMFRCKMRKTNNLLKTCLKWLNEMMNMCF